MIRPLLPDDEPSAEVILDATLGGRHQARLGEVHDVLALPGVGAWRDGALVGVATYALDGERAELAALGVVEGARGQGIGAALVDAVIEATAEQGADEVWLVTTNDNLDALRLYQRHGFRIERVNRGGVDEARALKPSIPVVGHHGIPLRDELVLTRRPEPLAGGVANAGAVTRVAGHVLRPANAHSRSIHRLLSTLRDTGLDAVPRPAGFTDDGRERLEYLDGDVAVPPYPEWVQTDEALASIATLLRRFHDSARAFDPSGETWSDEMADPAGGEIVCHNDVCLENVVFRDGVAVALLDFDFAAPGRPVYDLAQFARMCVPVDDDVNAARLGWRALDGPSRLRQVADAYGLDDVGRRELLDLLDESIRRGGQFVRRRVEAGDPNFIAMWNEMGGEERFDRRRRWWNEHAAEFRRALDVDAPS